MRCNQVSILIERFGKYVPKDYPGDVQRISVYVDDFKSIYAALSKAYALAVDELAEYEIIGVRANVSTNEFARADYREMHGQIPQGRRHHEDDINWEYNDSRLKLCEDCIWVYEHYEEITEVIKSSKDIREAKIALKEKFALSDYQIKKVLQFRVDMLTEQDYQGYREEAARIKEEKRHIPKRSSDYFEGDSYQRYTRSQICKLNAQIEELNAFLLAAEHQTEIIGLMEESDDFRYFAECMKERFGFSWEQSRAFQYMSIRDFSKERQAEMRKELERALESKEWHEKNLK